MYEKNNPSNMIPDQEVRVPKIIHQIWIGKEVPKEFADYINSWKEKHPDWEYRLWTQHDIASFGFVNKKYILESRNPGEISDLMRYEILYRYGGVYIDMDFECLHSLDELHYLYDFYIGLQPLDSDLLQVGIGIIGSIPKHPILKHVIDGISKNWENTLYKNMATARTGPIYMTRMFYRYAGHTGTRDIAFPAHYFYPLGVTEYGVHKNAWIDAGSYGVHYWAKSWLYPSFRRKEFQSIENY
jgi:mannosyltransferase OCH1-like enzyme